MHSMNSKTVYANFVAALFFSMIFIRFNIAYFSYAMVPFLLLFLYNALTDIFHHQRVLPSFQPIKWIIIGCLFFYGSIIFSEILKENQGGIYLATYYSKYIIPLFMAWYLAARYDIFTGVKWGIILGGLILVIVSCFFLFNHPFERLAIFKLHPNHVGTMWALLIPVSIYFWIKEKNLLLKTIMAFLIASELFCLYSTESRSAIFSLFIAAAISFALLISINKSISTKQYIEVGVAISIAVILAIASVFYINSSREGLQKIGGERIMMIEASYKMWDDHKLLGVGLDKWKENYYSDQYHPKEGTEKNLHMAHNMIVHFFATTGIIGGLGYLFLLVCSLYAFLRNRHYISDTALFLTGLTIFWIFTIHGMTDQTIINVTISRIYFALIGYCLVQSIKMND